MPLAPTNIFPSKDTHNKKQDEEDDLWNVTIITIQQQTRTQDNQEGSMRTNPRPNHKGPKPKKIAPTTTSITTSTTTSKDGKSRHQFSDTTFTSLDSISPNSKRALTEVLQYEYMTKVQEATLPSILRGSDVVAKAKTGSGKTTAFLLPIVEQLAKANQQVTFRKSLFFLAVILSPTRELANQIAVEFQKLATYHKGMKHQAITLIGGTNIDKDKRKLEVKNNGNTNNQNNLRVLIATPGRLQDHLNQNTADLVNRLKCVQVLCFDEADRLLDQGFRNELERIMGYMPQRHDAGVRQTLLFSATFPDVMKDITRLAMRPQYELIDTLDENEDDTNVQVVQKSLVTPIEHQMIALEHVMQDHIEQAKHANQAYKIIVFFTTARVAGFMAELFRADPRYPHYNDKNLLEMHSRKSQSYRTNVAKKFTEQSNVILFSSDVSARGVDYPNVSAVIQIGAPSEKAQYVHRLGRTARAGNAGVGIIILSDFERVFLQDIADFNVEPITGMTLTSEEAQQEQERLHQLLSSNEALEQSAKAAYQAFLGYYNSNIRRLKIKGKDDLVRIANGYATVIGFPPDDPPALQAKTVGKMGLKGVPGIKIDSSANFARNRPGNQQRNGGNNPNNSRKDTSRRSASNSKNSRRKKNKVN